MNTGEALISPRLERDVARSHLQEYEPSRVRHQISSQISFCSLDVDNTALPSNSSPLST